MSEMKCPFCQQELREICCCGIVVGYICPNPDCKKAEKLKGNTEFWQELIRTRKALEIAINAIKSAKDHNVVNCVVRGKELSTDDVHITLYKALNEITALKQKD